MAGHRFEVGERVTYDEKRFPNTVRRTELIVVERLVGSRGASSAATGCPPACSVNPNSHPGCPGKRIPLTYSSRASREIPAHGPRKCCLATYLRLTRARFQVSLVWPP